MLVFSRFSVVGLLALGLFAFGGSMARAEAAKVMVVGADALPETIPCDNRLHGLIEASVREAFAAVGFAVYGRSDLKVDGGLTCGTSQTDLTALMEQAAAPPLDMGVVFTAFPLLQKTNSLQWVSLRLEGRIIDLRNGKSLGDVEVRSPGRVPVGLTCTGSCLLEAASSHVASLGQDLGALLATRVRNRATRPAVALAPKPAPKPAAPVASGPSAFSLAFTNFSGDDLFAVEEYLAAFQGYQGHRVVNCGTQNCEYYYETEASAARLNRNLKRMLDYLGIEGRVAQGGKRFEIQKVEVLP